ncbi:hypothetical protein ACFQ8E_15055 [Isoptericola sp. NPDC056573]|uniref:hypothetical protein n=1 Tax=Isoptericola sp. NPDC056573 TaxID=3345868 RepID=UPI0036C28845
MPIDTETVDVMGRLAEEFVIASGAPDVFDFTVESIKALDLLVDSMLESASAEILDERFGLSMGAYAGEVIVRRSDEARWTYEIDQRAAAVRSTQFDAFPQVKVSKRITIGPEHSLEQFVRVALDDRMPPEARPMRTKGSGEFPVTWVRRRTP